MDETRVMWLGRENAFNDVDMLCHISVCFLPADNWEENRMLAEYVREGEEEKQSSKGSLGARRRDGGGGSSESSESTGNWMRGGSGRRGEKDWRKKAGGEEQGKGGEVEGWMAARGRRTGGRRKMEGGDGGLEWRMGRLGVE